MEKPFVNLKLNRVGFVGLGLIGGSIALKLKELYPDTEIIVRTHSQSTVDTAYKMGICDNPVNASVEDFAKCSLIFLCAPVEANIEYLRLLSPYVNKGCVITDVGSTKEKMHECASELGLDCQFIGGHPMTGSEKTGLSYANPILLENAYYVITSAERTDPVLLQDYVSLVRALGSIPVLLDSRVHDRATAAISHLPHMIAFALTNFIKSIDTEDETMKMLAAGSFRDMTRVAASDPSMWESIVMSNRESVLELMDRYMDSFDELRNLIADQQDQLVCEYFAEAKEYRDSLAIPGQKIKRLVHEIYLDLNDETGQIALIATLLAFRQVNLKNIGIINNREFESGVLRIEFYDEKAKETAITILQERNYQIHIR